MDILGGKRRGEGRFRGRHARDCGSPPRARRNNPQEFPLSRRKARIMIALGERPLSLDDIRNALAGPIIVQLTAKALALIERSAATVARLLQTGDAIYGVNTGFGKLAKTRI